MEIDDPLIRRSSILACSGILFLNERPVDQEINMSKNGLDAWISAFGQLFKRIAGINRDMKPIVLKTVDQFGNGLGLIKWFATENRNAVMRITFSYNLGNDFRD